MADIQEQLSLGIKIFYLVNTIELIATPWTPFTMFHFPNSTGSPKIILALQSGDQQHQAGIAGMQPALHAFSSPWLLVGLLLSSAFFTQSVTAGILLNPPAGGPGMMSSPTQVDTSKKLAMTCRLYFNW